MHQWRREGWVLGPGSGHPWWNSHAHMPTVLPLGDELWRIYFSGRDRENHSRIIAVDVDPSRRMQVVAEHFMPLIDLGPLGSFDQAGTIASSAIRVNGQVWLYYVGVSLRPEVRAVTAIGLAISDDGLDFRRAYDGPVLGIGPLDPFHTMSPCVRADAGGFRMWYVSGTPWLRDAADSRPEPAYGIRLARSQDGRMWAPDTSPVIDPAAPVYVGLARPWVCPSRDGLRLWYSRRGNQFREGGESAYRLAQVPLDPSTGLVTGAPQLLEFGNPPREEDFDGWMQAYGCVTPCGPDLVMIYNGNHFGQTGFGWARLPGGAPGRSA